MEVLSVAIILGTPWLSHSGVSLAIVDNLLVRLLLVAFVLYAIRCSPLCGVLALLAVVTLVLERNAQLITLLPGQTPVWPKTNQGYPLKAAPLTPEVEAVHYDFHQEEQGVAVGEHMFESAKDIEDSNPRLQEGPHGSDAEGTGFYQAKGFVSVESTRD
jgi:hypothetical protein